MLDASIESLLAGSGSTSRRTSRCSSAPIRAAGRALPGPSPVARPPEGANTLRALVNLFLRDGSGAAFLIAIENLQWADATTLALTGLLADELRAAKQISSQAGPKLFVLCTTRPRSSPLGRGRRVMPLQRLLPGRCGSDGESQRCRPEPPWIPGSSLGSHGEPEGVPLFVEELMRTLVGHGHGRPGRRRPPSRRAFATLLTARLDRSRRPRVTRPTSPPSSPGVRRTSC